MEDRHASPTTTLGKLPLELLREVIDYLQVQDKVNLAAVNKEWRAFAEANEWYWHDLCFRWLWRRRGDRRGHDFNNLYAEFLAEEHRPTEDQTPTNLELSAESDHLESYYSGCINLNSLVIPFMLRANFRVRLLFIKSLRLAVDWDDLRLDRCRHLTHLGLAIVTSTVGGPLQDINCNIPSLRRIDLCGTFDLSVPLRFLQNCLNLETARFSCGPLRSDNSEFIYSGRISPKLESLDFDITLFEDDSDGPVQFPTNVLERAIELKELIIRGDHLSIASNFLPYSNLETLHIPQCLQLSRVLVPNGIRELIIPLEEITQDSFVSKMPELRKLKVLYHSYGYMEDSMTALTKVMGSVGDKLEELFLADLGDFDPELGASLGDEVIICIEKMKKTFHIRRLSMEFESTSTSGENLLGSIARVFPGLQELYLYGLFKNAKPELFSHTMDKLCLLREFGFDSDLVDEDKYKNQWSEEKYIDCRPEWEILNPEYFLLSERHDELPSLGQKKEDAGLLGWHWD